MTLTIYNTLTRRKEAFQPQEPGKVKMYCCGVTVYDYCHLGHARSYIGWDVVRRYFQWRGYEIEYVQNFTDIDDKILNRANLEGTSMEEVSQRYIDAYFEDIRRLNVLDASAYPRVTENISSIHQLIQELEKRGYAYAANGDVYYNVGHFSEYGKLSGRVAEDMQAGASGRVDVEDSLAQKKQNSADFALWKAAKPGEPAWDSPWGAGRPGWHIECSAMVRSILGDTIDIHGGGGDLVFPHHENEIAQSEVVTGKPLARYWIHNGMVTVNGEKMSKSLGNFTTIRELLDQGIDPMVVRLFILQGHYRRPLDFTSDAIASAENAWKTVKEGLLFGYQYAQKLGMGSGKELIPNPYIESFQGAMDDDFNTPGALAVVFELAKELRRQSNLLTHEGKTDSPPEQIQQQWQTLVNLAQVLGLEAQPEAPSVTASRLTDEEIQIFIQQRQAARQAKNFAESDRIRNELQELGITLIDQSDGTTRWHS
ncbi:cysteine--tRNA ligase [Nodularia sphaerocarpa]|uniref:cysteine--tRNA ligase n=1 Tax=Nodularia sphaerocarpa TaxID=137816 RepID=UPI001EFA68F9|nr:cysteine--tRNA ligase [Nodularia sphaerocarpa]MDB9373425.1 cysteine--tRNA ligase [Nodularia sphaerocarpa CS-585]MDB9378194.1 cysteine--tRNA ligase [Nodularia sphaerocarpa CS-585A2]ULP71419.1 Cysteine--tRNA ligase [Nodularia sphaerocarpa UHCC 0038]